MVLRSSVLAVQRSSQVVVPVAMYHPRPLSQRPIPGKCSITTHFLSGIGMSYSVIQCRMFSYLLYDVSSQLAAPNAMPPPSPVFLAKPMQCRGRLLFKQQHMLRIHTMLYIHTCCTMFPVRFLFQ